MAFHKATALDDLWRGEMLGLVVEGKPVLLVNLDGVIRAYLDACPHQKSRLSAGSLSADRITCATHQWTFDACTGAGINPRQARLHSLPVVVDAGDILVDTDSD
jgi:toluene monooxygenase system ferredoxin subunit